MDEHIAASAPFKGVRLNTSYSYGIDDQDFVSRPTRTTRKSSSIWWGGCVTWSEPYTQRDTPMFPCAKAPIDAILAQLANID